jgi:peptidylprolyl isomerase
MSTAKKGDKVKVHYTGTLGDGSVFDSSANREPLEFTIGNGELIPGFEDGVEGMELNEKKSFTIPSAEAYGDRKDELVIQMPLTNLPEGLDPQIGQQLQLTNDQQQTFVVVVSDISDDSVSLDANHPLAGKDLTFEIELMEIA